MWNGHDDRLKERLFGLTNPEGNHGEDVKVSAPLRYFAGPRTRTACDQTR
jgi:hypothetical protein